MYHLNISLVSYSAKSKTMTVLSMLWMEINGLLLGFSDNTKLGGIDNNLDDKIKPQKDFKRLKQWAGINKMKYNRNQYRYLLSGKVPKYR